ncbi:NfeD family protein [Kallotenue papyrolyticum]|uniref:NfeD family protein n=1 Tax=Kallotenue papyrolyticum TaxID=1325125 RepID=UPI0004786465|nr:NfeD family protein [Kallotenue papyrolyticum]
MGAAPLPISRWRSTAVLLLTMLGVLCGWQPATTQAQVPAQVYYVTLRYGLTEPAAHLARRALREAEAAGATALIVEVRGGGSLRAAWPLARDLAAARVPVVVYIAPRGTSGGPVGALLLAASHVAAMAPEASVGVAAPLVVAPAGVRPTTQQLLVEDAARQVTAWARARGRNAAWFEQAVRQGAIIDAERARALEPPLIELVATPEELLAGLQGRRVVLEDGSQRTLETLGARVQPVRPTLLESIGQLLALPTVAFLLFVLGGLAIYLELTTPGMGIPGATGALLVLAALVGFVLGDVRAWAVLLLAVALVVIGLEHVVASHGALTLLGVVLLALGAIMLVDPARAPGLRVSPLVIGGVVALLGSAAFGLALLTVRLRRQRPVTGQEALIGRIAEVRKAVDPEGQVFVNGALWLAWSDEGPFHEGELVRVAGVHGLRLYVQRVSEE